MKTAAEVLLKNKLYLLQINTKLKSVVRKASNRSEILKETEVSQSVFGAVCTAATRGREQ